MPNCFHCTLALRTSNYRPKMKLGTVDLAEDSESHSVGAADSAVAVDSAVAADLLCKVNTYHPARYIDSLTGDRNFHSMNKKTHRNLDGCKSLNNLMSPSDKSLLPTRLCGPCRIHSHHLSHIQF